MFANLNRVILAGYIGSIGASSTCYVSDVSILGSGNVTISNVLKCISNSQNNTDSSITTCMDQTYPNYGLVSAECLDCITNVMQSSVGNSCLPTCIQDMTSSDCNACAPSLVTEWTSTCDQGLTNPVEPASGSNGSADTPIVAVCSAGDKSLIQTGASFVVPSLNCLKDLTNFQSCLKAGVPYYDSISTGCKACASATTTPSGMIAEDCGAICMQQPASSTECGTCAGQLATSFDQMCLDLSSSSGGSGGGGSGGNPTTPKGSIGIQDRILFAVVATIAVIIVN